MRGAYNAVAMMSSEELATGVYTASAGNMAQGVAWAARQTGARCAVVVPDGAPETKLAAVRRLGAEIVSLPYGEWWNVLATHRYAPLEPARFIHPVSDVAVMAGNGTIGLEILEDMPEVGSVLVPYGGGGLSWRRGRSLSAASSGARRMRTWPRRLTIATTTRCRC